MQQQTTLADHPYLFSNTSMQEENNAFIRSQKAEFLLTNNYASLNEDSLTQFQSEITKYASITALFIQQNYFYSNPSDWSDFADSISILITSIPHSLRHLKNLYIKLDIHCPSGHLENPETTPFRRIAALNHDIILSNSKQEEYAGCTNIFDVISLVLDRAGNSFDVSVILHANGCVQTMPFFNSLGKISRLKSLDVKYYFEDSIQQFNSTSIFGTNNNNNNNNSNEDQMEGDNHEQYNIRTSHPRMLLQTFFRSIGSCKAIEKLRMNVHGKVSLVHHTKGGSSTTFDEEIKELMRALASCKAVYEVVLQLPVQFFFAGFIAEKHMPAHTSSLKRNLSMLCKSNSIKYFELILFREKHAFDLRRKTLQIRSLEKQIHRNVQSTFRKLVSFNRLAIH